MLLASPLVSFLFYSPLVSPLLFLFLFLFLFPPLRSSPLLSSPLRSELIIPSSPPLSSHD